MPSLYLKTASSIILVMAMNGFLTVIDAYFLGAYFGAEVLDAVTLIFCLPYLLGANGIWRAGAGAEAAMIFVMMVLLWQAGRSNGFRWGLLCAAAPM